MNSVSKRRFDLIAFDWDGTLFDSTAIIVRSIQGAVRDVGGSVPSDKDAAYVIGLGLGQALAHAAPDVPKEKYPLLGERYKHHYGREQDQITLFPGVLEMLAELKARQYLLAVATGKSRWGLDQALAQHNEHLPQLQEFILPAGNRAASLAHVCRTVARRAERAVVALGNEEALKEAPRQYLNRLSDLMFVLARVLNRHRTDGTVGDDVYWKSERLARGE